MSDAQLRADIKAVRDSLAEAKIICRMGPDPFWEDLLAVIDATDPLPADVMIIWTVLGDADPVPVSDPALTQRQHRAADSPMTASAERRTSDPPEPEQADPLTLERVMRMARRRQLKPYHTGRDIALTDAAGETRYSGTVAEVYEALKQDTVARMPPDPAALLRERLANAPWNWTLETDGPDRYTLTRNGERRYTGALDDISMIAERSILNTTLHLGYPE